MGVVWAAHDDVLDAPVAIKILLADLDSPLAQRFLQEARAAAKLRHPNIVTVLDVGRDNDLGVMFMVQEYLRGRDLKRYLHETGPLPPAEAIALLLPIMRALSFAHSQRVVHRDLKPENIFLCDTPDGLVPKVIDFGIARVTDLQGQSAQQTQIAQVMGSPSYMSPEQAGGDRALDARTDVWSLGVVLYYALTRRLPHEGRTVNLILTSILSQPPTPIALRVPTLPQPVVQLVGGALAVEPERRYPTMDAFAQHARSCLEALQGFGPSAPLAQTRLSAVSVPPPPDLVTAAPQVLDTTLAGPAQARRRRLAAALSGLSLLVGVAIVGGYLSARADSVSRAAPPVASLPTASVEAVPPAMPEIHQAPVRPVAAPSSPVVAVAPLPVAPSPASAPVPAPAPAPLVVVRPTPAAPSAPRAAVTATVRRTVQQRTPPVLNRAAHAVPPRATPTTARRPRWWER